MAIDPEAFAVAVPVAPVDVEEFKRFAGDVLGPWRRDQDASRRRLGMIRERWWVQQTPKGGVVILLLEGDDPAEATRRLAESTDAYDEWFKDSANATLDLDLSQPLDLEPELLYSSVKYYQQGKQGVAMAVPLLPGQTDAWRALAEQVGGDGRADFDDLHHRVGLQEKWWLEETPEGDLAIMYLESDDLDRAVSGLVASDHPYDVWYKEQLRQLQGADWGAAERTPAATSELLLDWQAVWARSRRGR